MKDTCIIDARVNDARGNMYKACIYDACVSDACQKWGRPNERTDGRKAEFQEQDDS